MARDRKPNCSRAPAPSWLSTSRARARRSTCRSKRSARRSSTGCGTRCAPSPTGRRQRMARSRASWAIGTVVPSAGPTTRTRSQSSSPVTGSSVPRASSPALPVGSSGSGGYWSMRGYCWDSARALHHLVHAHGLVGPALAIAQTRRAQSAAPLGRVRLTLLRMTVAHDPAATAAGFETRGTGRMLALGADALMRRAVRHAARRAQARVLFAGGLLVHAAARDAVFGAEIRRAHGTPRGASLTRAVAALAFPLLVHADH